MKQKKNGRKIVYILLYVLIFLLLIGTSLYFFDKKKESNIPNDTIVEEKEPDVEEPKREEYNLRLGMIGDALYHTGCYKDGLQSDGTYNFDKQLADITPIVRGYDLAYYNQETILGGVELELSSYPNFNSPQEVGDAFVKAGFNLVSLANNHTLDKGQKAILNSAQYWRKQTNVMTAGSYDSLEDKARSHIGEKNGITYAFLAYTYGTNGIPVPKGKEYLVNLFDYEKARADIEAVRDQVDVVLVSMHWGVEYTHVPTQEQRKQAQFLSDLGVDVIIGSHPHVIQPIEHIGKTVVIYSLGNFISGQKEENQRIGMIASVDIHKVVEDGVTTISVDNVKGDLVYTERTAGFRNFRILPFYKMDNSILPNYINVKTKYESIINKTNDPNIQVGTLSSDDEVNI